MPVEAMTEELKPCPDALLPDGPTCPRCGQERGPSGVDGGSWVHYRRPPAPADAPQAGRVVEPPYLPSYGKIPWDRLKAAVDDAVGCTQKWDGEHYIGHQTAPINMNSLNRIVSGFVAEATPPSAPAADLSSTRTGGNRQVARRPRRAAVTTRRRAEGDVSFQAIDFNTA